MSDIPTPPQAEPAQPTDAPVKLKSWKTTIGGALTSTGMLMWSIPVAVATCKVEVPGDINTYCIICGIILQALGHFLSGLFAKDYDVTGPGK